MKSIPLILLTFPVMLSVCGQVNAPVRGEFATQANGLMYPDSTMRKLSHIVDSLHVRFKSCNNNPEFISCMQGSANIIYLAGVDSLGEIQSAMKRNMEFSAFVAKFKAYITKIDTSQTVIKRKGRETRYYYALGTPVVGYSDSDFLDDSTNQAAGRWTWSYSGKGQYEKRNTIRACYWQENLHQQKIPVEYGRYIEYVDCMIDTNATIFLGKATDDDETMSGGASVKALNDYLNRKLKLKKKIGRDSLFTDYDFEYITDKKCIYAHEHLRSDSTFKRLLCAAIDSCPKYGLNGESLEILAADFISKEKSLEVMRHRMVIGRCSQDASPRLHALNIALLSAETNSWDIFLRAHLDIMNDHFERRSDGNYAYGGRKTYLKELEVLDLNIVDLMMGLSLRAENMASNHYLGTIWRLGWALSESRDSSRFEEKAIQMMKDNRLDEFNRGLIFLLYQNYIYTLQDPEATNKKVTAMKHDSGNYPTDIKSAIMQLKPRSKTEKNEL